MRQEGKHAGEMLARLRDRFGDRGPARYRGAIGDLQMAGEIGRAADHAEAAYLGAARDRGAAGDHGMGADAHVMRDLDLIIDLAAVLDHGIAHRAAVDRGVGADLDIVAEHGAAGLRNLDVFDAVGSNVRRKTETVGPDHRAAVDDAALPDHATVIDRYVGVQQRVVADLRAGADIGIGQHAHALAEPGAGFDHDIGADIAGGGHHRIIRDAGARIDAGARVVVGGAVELLRDAREADIGIARDQPVAAVGAALLANAVEVGRRDDHRGGRRGQRLRQIQRIGQEGQLPFPCLIERREAAHGQRGITHNLRAGVRGELTQCGCLHRGTSWNDERGRLTCRRRSGPSSHRR